MSDEIIEPVEAVNAVPSAETAGGMTVEDLQRQVKPLSDNAFVKFWQKILRWWLGIWYGFCDKKPKLSALIYKVFFFIVFSMGVTIWQLIIIAIVPQFLPKTGAVGWPMIPIESAGNNNFTIFGDQDGWATFICFEIAVFTAQCINFPLQRNITYRSHGNPYWQAMWYFIGWVLVSIATNSLWSVCNAYLIHWGSPDIVNGLLKTVLTGGVSLVVFFFIFMIIFPDNNKMAKSAKAKYDKLVTANASPEAIAKAEAKMKLWEGKAELSNAEKEYFQAKSQVNASVMKYNAIVKASQNEKLTEEEKAEYPAKIQKAFDTAVEAVKVKDEKETAFNAVKASQNN